MPRAQVRIRDAAPGDLGQLRGVFRRSALSNEGDRQAMLAHPELLVFELPAREARIRVAVLDGTIAGFATVRIAAGDRLELDDLFVDPPAMRTGIGSALVADLSDWAKVQGYRSIEVTANPHALAFYERVGFVEVGTADTRFGPALRMRRPVTRAPD